MIHRILTHQVLFQEDSSTTNNNNNNNNDEEGIFYMVLPRFDAAACV
jgi:hypothetical protein